ncbi:Rho GTPase-activating protein 4 [Liparis tanakae]|uniref:Rho GTPase-activating protein 4 n=1 Tax=Liparis tanakae TaxID=230148 RepID=A0A4Z2E1A9_9TELE|nr:Rho GTPase-activating protein 4 [Liparis tanakae]
MNKYYLQDVSTLIDCCDLGFHLSVERVMNCYLASRGRIQKTEESGLKQLEAAVASLDQSGDRDGLLQQHDAAFCLPFRFSYHPHEGDQVSGGGAPTREKINHVVCTLYLEHRRGTEAVVSSVTSLTTNCDFFRGCWSTADPLCVGFW